MWESLWFGIKHYMCDHHIQQLATVMGLKTLTEQGVLFEIRILQQRFRHCLSLRDLLIKIYNDPIIIKAQ